MWIDYSASAAKYKPIIVNSRGNGIWSSTMKECHTNVSNSSEPGFGQRNAGGKGLTKCTYNKV
mgnify:CR=1 FL=1